MTNTLYDVEKYFVLDSLKNNSIFYELNAQETDFQYDEIRDGYRAAKGFYSTNGHIDLVDLIALYNNTPEWIFSFITEWNEYFATIGGAYAKLKKMRAEAAKRDILKVLNDSDMSQDLEALSDITSLAGQSMVSVKPKDADKLSSDYLREYGKKLDGKSKGQLPTFTTGFDYFDERVGISRGTLTTLAARTSVGKSAFALTMGLNMAFYGSKVMYISLEMTEDGMMDRIASRLLQVSNTKLKHASITHKGVSDALEEFKGLTDRFRMIVDPRATVGQIEAIVKNEVMGRGLDVVIIDHLHYMIPPAKQNPAAFYGEAAAAFHNLALGENISVILLAQVNRNVQEGAMPEVSDIRESGRIEEASDNILLLNRTSRDSTEASLHVAKVRNGSLGTVELVYEPKYTLFREVKTYKQKKIDE